MDQINHRDGSREARFVSAAVQAWAKRQGIYSAEFGPPLSRLNVELRVNGVEVPFSEVLAGIYEQMIAQIDEEATRLMEQRWAQWLEQAGGSALVERLQDLAEKTEDALRRMP